MTAKHGLGRPSKGPRRSKLLQMPVAVADSLKDWSEETDIDQNTLIVVALCQWMGLSVPAEYDEAARRVRPPAAVAASLNSMEELDLNKLLLLALCRKLNIEVPIGVVTDARRGGIAA